MMMIIKKIFDLIINIIIKIIIIKIKNTMKEIFILKKEKNFLIKIEKILMIILIILKIIIIKNIIINIIILDQEVLIHDHLNHLVHIQNQNQNQNQIQIQIQLLKMKLKIIIFITKKMIIKTSKLIT